MTSQTDDEATLHVATTPSLGKHSLVLWGGGHTNTQIVKRWAMRPIRDARLTLISDFSVATYSGMLPAVLAGQHPQEAMEINLVRLCRLANVRLIQDLPTGLDKDRKCLLFSRRPPMQFDALSIGIGSIPNAPVPKATQVRTRSLAIKPMQTFLGRLRAALDEAEQIGEGATLSVAVVGAGTAGVEIASCITRFLENNSLRPIEVNLLTRSQRVLTGSSARATQLAEKALERCNVRIIPGTSVSLADDEGSELQLLLESENDGSSETRRFDIVIWATGAVAHPILRDLGLPHDDRGFVLTDASLRSLGAHSVFVVGDSGTIQSRATAKAGVYAVRQGPILWENFQRLLSQRPLLEYRPQRRFLKLINTSDGQAIGEWGPFALHNRSMRWLKEAIDFKFMKQFQLAPMQGSEAAKTQCLGCGCKLSAQGLRDALRLSLHNQSASKQSPAAKDAVPVGDRQAGLLASTDFFGLPFSDPYLNGRVSVIHSCSDLLASGAQPIQLLANVVVPPGSSHAQSVWLGEFLGGARDSAAALDAELVAGHTIIGPRAEAGFTAIGQLATASIPLAKDSLQAGDDLYLTKPLGIGVILAAEMQGRCSAAAYDQAIAQMLEPQIAWLRVCRKLAIHAATDVTGFGFAGHLAEMLSSGSWTATIPIASVPVIEPAIDLSQSGVTSSLFNENRVAAGWVLAAESAKQNPKYNLLFDPQTCGGILFSVAGNQGNAVRQAFQEHGLASPSWVGSVSQGDEACIRIR